MAEQIHHPSLIHLKKDNLVNHIWGGHWIPNLKNLSTTPPDTVGESWEFSVHPKHPSQVQGFQIENPSLLSLLEKKRTALFGTLTQNKDFLPFLLKFVDAKDNLSLQVHPDDAYAKQHESDPGKSESWIILDVGSDKEEGMIYLGFSGHHKEKFLKALHSTAPIPSQNSVLSFLNKTKVKPGDIFHVPAGTIHSIGKGIRLLEIQQSSDLTYRLWDWNRPVKRPLHLEKGESVLNFKGTTLDSFRGQKNLLPSKGKGKIQEWQMVLNKDKKFGLNQVELYEKGSQIEWLVNQTFFVLTGFEGQGVLAYQLEKDSDWQVGGNLGPGETVFISAENKAIRLESLTEKTTVFKSYP